MASKTAREALNIISIEERIIQDLKPSVVYLEDSLEQVFSKGELEHHLNHYTSEVGAETVYLGIPDGFEEQYLDFRARVKENPQIIKYPRIRKEARELLEQKDYPWAELISKDVEGREDIGLLIAGSFHLVEDHWYRGLTSKLLGDGGNNVEILQYFDPVIISKKIGMDPNLNILL